MARDLIITIFSQPSQQQLDKYAGGLKVRDVFPVHKLSHGVDVISLEKSQAGHVCNKEGKCCDQGDIWGGFCFDQLAAKLRAAGGGSIIRGVLKQRGKNPASYSGGRIALITFSAGSTMARHILNNPEDERLIDTVISLDSMAFAKNGSQIIPHQGYMNFALRATGQDRMRDTGSNPYLGPMMVIARTSIVSNSQYATSTREASQYVFDKLNPGYWQAIKSVPASVQQDQGRRQKEIIARLRSNIDRLPLPMQVGSSKGCKPGKTYTRSSAYPSTLGYLGNLWSLGYPGTQGSDHCFMVYVLQGVIMNAFLIPRWNSDNVAIAGFGGLGGPFGQAKLDEGAVTFQTPTPSERGGGVVNPGVLPFAVPGWARVAGAFALMGGLGYLVGKAIDE